MDVRYIAYNRVAEIETLFPGSADCNVYSAFGDPKPVANPIPPQFALFEDYTERT